MFEHTDKISADEYHEIAGADWPSYQDFLSGNNVPDFVYEEIRSLVWKLEAKENPAFCILPFYGLEIPLNIRCCLMRGNQSNEEIRREMLAGIRPKSCSACWALEDAGLRSDRQIKNSTLDAFLNKDIDLIYQDCLDGKNTELTFKIDTNNVCNATCVTCGSHYSSAWRKLEQENDVKPHKIWHLKKAEIDDSVNYSTVRSIGFRGGESTLSKTNFEILKKLVESGNTDCQVTFTTNGSFNFSESQKDLLREFKNLNFCFSIDGIRRVFEYMRYPLKWDTILENIDWCNREKFIVSVCYTVSNANVLYYTETTDWFKQNKIDYLVNFVSIPSYFSPTALPQHVKEKIVSLNPELAFKLAQHNSMDDENYEQFLNEIRKQDSWKGISIKDYLPELYDLLSAKP